MTQWGYHDEGQSGTRWLTGFKIIDNGVAANYTTYCLWRI